MRVMGIEGDLSFNSVSDLKSSISQIRGGIAQGANMVRCGWELLGPQGLQFLGQLIEGVGGAIGSIVDEIMDAIAIQISMAAQQIIGCVTAVINAFLNLVSSILLLTEIIGDMIDSWTDWSGFQFELGLKEAQCKDMYAAIAGCLLNKFLGPYLEEFSSKIVGKINEVGNDFNSKLYDELQDANTFASYANHEAFLVKKASIQLAGLTKESILSNGV